MSVGIVASPASLPFISASIAGQVLPALLFSVPSTDCCDRCQEENRAKLDRAPCLSLETLSEAVACEPLCWIPIRQIGHVPLVTVPLGRVLDMHITADHGLTALP